MFVKVLGKSGGVVRPFSVLVGRACVPENWLSGLTLLCPGLLPDPGQLLMAVSYFSFITVILFHMPDLLL